MKHGGWCLILVAGSLAGCATDEDQLPSEKQADVRAVPALSIAQTISTMVHEGRDWEMAQFRRYRQEDIDGDGIDDTVLLTTFEHYNGWRRELFVCLSSSPHHVMHLDLGGKGERMAEDMDITNRTIIVTGKRYSGDDAMCCPSVPYQTIFAISGGKIQEKR